MPDLQSAAYRQILADIPATEMSVFDDLSRYVDPLCNYAIHRLHTYARVLVESDFHRRSETHIFFCLIIGRQGVRGVGTSSDTAFDNYIGAVDVVLHEAKREELAYWLSRCEAVHAKGQQHVVNVTVARSRSALSGQIGIRISAKNLKRIDDQAFRNQKSRNAFVQSLLESELRMFDDRADKVSLAVLLGEIEQSLSVDDGNGGDDGRLEAWSQRVPENMQARILLAAKELKIGSAKLCRYLLTRAIATLDSTKTRNVMAGD